MTKTQTIPSAVLSFARGRAAVNVLLVLGGSALIALAAQMAIPLPFTPVPLTMQPLAVLIVGVALGSARGAFAAALNTLVSFGTRSTLSTQTDPKRGIGAARDWIKSEFDKIAATSGGRMTVELQTFTQEPGKYPRIAKPTVLTNVVATLRGTQSPDRVYIVSGHYDSMCSSPTDGECDAPGADDDASGVAAVLEAARAMAPHEFDATIIFMAVAGEEQGLVGSTYFAEQAKQKNMDIEAMFTNDIVGANPGKDPRI